MRRYPVYSGNPTRQGPAPPGNSPDKPAATPPTGLKNEIRKGQIRCEACVTEAGRPAPRPRPTSRWTGLVG
jgi:hypothetical protein